MTTRRFGITPEAADQLAEPETYLSKVASPAVAERYIHRLLDSLRKIAVAPHQGTRRDDFGQGLRTTGFERRATILFHADENQVTIAGVFYGGCRIKPPK